METIIPYDGKENFIFISYSHRDTDRVMPIVKRLSDKGFRVWYDMGIDPGTEWDENIAEHIGDCGYFIAFMSENYLGSNNCKDELNYARDLEKDRLIIYLEEVTLPRGMAMRVNRLQSIFKYTYSNEEMFYDKLYTSNNINSCLGEKAMPAAPEAAEVPAIPVAPVTPAVPAAPVTPVVPVAPVAPVRTDVQTKVVTTNTAVKTKKSAFPLIAFIVSAVSMIAAFISTPTVFLFFLFSAVTIVFGILSFKKNDKKAIRILSLVFKLFI